MFSIRGDRLGLFTQEKQHIDLQHCVSDSYYSVSNVFLSCLLILRNVSCHTSLPSTGAFEMLTHCGRVTKICVFNTVKLGTSASSPQCHFTRGNVSRGTTPSSTTRVFGEYFLEISVRKNSQRICYKFLKKHSIKVD